MLWCGVGSVFPTFGQYQNEYCLKEHTLQKLHPKTRAYFEQRQSIWKLAIPSGSGFRQCALHTNTPRSDRTNPPI